MLALPKSADAIVADPKPRICSAFSSADIVLTGIVGKERVDWKWDRWPVKVDHVYKGKVPTNVTLYSENASTRATPDEGKRNFLFVYRRGKRLVALGSAPNTSGPDAARIEREVQQMAKTRPGKTGSVIGLVESEGGEPSAGWSVRLRHVGTRLTRTIRTDRTGKFSIDLPPGKWSAKVIEPGWTSRFSVYSYDLADHFSLKAGGCADLRLEPIKR